MSEELAEVDFQRFWRRLQQLGLNAYESRSYLVLLGHPKFKALELAARAHVPRQKIYEVLDSLVEKGFAQVIQEKTKLFTAVDPTLSIPSYLARRNRALQHEINEQARTASGLIEDLRAAFQDGQGVGGSLDFLTLVNDPTQTAVHYQRMLGRVKERYEEFSRPPFAVDPLDEQMVLEAARNGAVCRLLFEDAPADSDHRARLEEYCQRGVQVRFLE